MYVPFHVDISYLLLVFPVLTEPSNLKALLVDSEEFVAGVYRWEQNVIKSVLLSHRYGGHEECICVKIEITKLCSVQPCNEVGANLALRDR